MKRIISLLAFLGVFVFLSQILWIVGNTIVWVPLRILLILGFSILYMKWPKSEIGITTGGFSLTSLVTTGIVTGIALYVFVGINSILNVWEIFGSSSTGSSINITFVIRAILLGIILAPIMEEFYYRGFLCALIKNEYKSNTFFIMMATAIIFSLGHFSFSNPSISSLLYVILMIPVAVVLARLFLEKGSLIPVIIAHMIINSFDVVVILSSGTFYGNYLLYVFVVLSVVVLAAKKDVLLWLRDIAGGTIQGAGVVMGIILFIWGQLCTYGGLYVQRIFNTYLGEKITVSIGVLWIQRFGLIAVCMSILYLILKRKNHEENDE